MRLTQKSPIFSQNEAARYHRISKLTQKRRENEANLRACRGRFRPPLANWSQLTHHRRAGSCH